MLSFFPFLIDRSWLSSCMNQPLEKCHFDSKCMDFLMYSMSFSQGFQIELLIGTRESLSRVQGRLASPRPLQRTRQSRQKSSRFARILGLILKLKLSLSDSRVHGYPRVQGRRVHESKNLDSFQLYSF